MSAMGHKVHKRKGGSAATALRLRKLLPKKHITFAREGNKVRFVKVPPRSMNHHFWFTETESIVKKGIFFEVEPNINVSVDVGCRMQLTTLAAQPSSSIYSSGGDGNKRRNGGARVFLEIESSPPNLLGAAVRTARWLTVASVHENELEKVRVILPSGTHTLRCSGQIALQVFAQVWDVESKLG